jgi:serine/threonine protein kinase
MMIGRTISHYQITEKIGEGGMGVVYKARDTHLDRFVAIKILPTEKVADPDRKARFVREAKSASALNHPNIVHIYDIDQQDGIDFMAMEFVAGKTLGQLIPHKGMLLNEALRVAVQVADALAAPHEAGIVHRDLKPGNILVGDDGRVRVLDFGLAKLTEAIPESDETRTAAAGEAPDTEEGTILGTASYMLPEQAEGRAVDVRSDIFSFGSVFYEMVTGRRAFQGDSRMSTLAAILKEERVATAPLLCRGLFHWRTHGQFEQRVDRGYQLNAKVRTKTGDLKYGGPLLRRFLPEVTLRRALRQTAQQRVDKRSSFNVIQIFDSRMRPRKSREFISAFQGPMAGRGSVVAGFTRTVVSRVRRGIGRNRANSWRPIRISICLPATHRERAADL